MSIQYHRAPFAKHLHNLAVSGFFARDLDADDHAFIEGVRVRGVVEAGSLAGSMKGVGSYIPRALIAPAEELSFWQHHWETEPGIPRREYRPLTPAQAVARSKEAERRRVNRISVTAAKEEAFHEWAEQQARMAEERERRILRNTLADLEWEAAGALQRAKLRAATTPHIKPEPLPVLVKFEPKKPRGVYGPRHYVPQWKIEEDKRAETARLILEANAQLAANAAARKAAEEAEEARIIRERMRREAQATALARAAEEAQHEQARQAQLSYDRMIAAKRAQQVQATIMSVTSHAAQPAPQSLPSSLTQYSLESNRRADREARLVRGNEIKRAMITAIRGSGKIWTVEALMEVAKCDDREFLLQCASELVGDGFLRPSGNPR